MDGIDALRAMKEGKIAVFDVEKCQHSEFRFKGGRVEVKCRSRDGKEYWKQALHGVQYFMTAAGTWSAKDPEPTFDLTFVEAFKAMLEGKKVSNAELPNLIQYIEDGKIYYHHLYGEDFPERAGILLEEQAAMWRVVE